MSAPHPQIKFEDIYLIDLEQWFLTTAQPNFKSVPLNLQKYISIWRTIATSAYKMCF